MQDILARAAKIKLLVFDVDGVLTDGSLYLTEQGEELKAFNSRDGHGMKMLQSTGVDIAIITGRTSNIVSHRMQELEIKYVYQGQKNKLLAYQKLLSQLSLTAEQIAYIGDDIVDLPVMRKVGLSVAVQDAHDLVKKYAHWLTPSNGGKGAGRDICELIMQARGTLDSELEKYL